MGNDLVERLRNPAHIEIWVGKHQTKKETRLDGVALMRDAEEAAARIEALEGALKPLAEEVKAWTKMDDSYRPAAYSGAFSVGDLRRAARAYANKGKLT